MKYFGLLVLIVISGCSGTYDMEPSKKAVNSFHSSFNKMDFDAIYASATEEFQKSESKENIKKYFNGVDKKLGKHSESNLTNWRVFSGLSGKRVSLTYESTFENGKAKETFTFTEVEGKIMLVHYNIQSKVFIAGS